MLAKQAIQSGRPIAGEGPATWQQCRAATRTRSNAGGSAHLLRGFTASLVWDSRFDHDDTNRWLREFIVAAASERQLE